MDVETTPPEKPTQAQQAILRYLAESKNYMDREFSGGDLIDLYHRRWLRAHTPKDASESLRNAYAHLTAGDPRSHAWRRTGGLQLRRMQEGGWLRRTDIRWGVSYYQITKKGADWIAANPKGDLP